MRHTAILVGVLMGIALVAPIAAVEDAKPVVPRERVLLWNGKLHDSSEKPAGEWNQYDIVCKDNWVVVLVNGALQNVATECSERPGQICLQSEGAPIEYRNIWIEPLQ